MIVSMLSVALAGSKTTRLFKQGSAGKLVEYVDDSCTAKPWGRSSRSITFKLPPGFGAWPTAMDAPAMTAVAASIAPSVRRAKRKRVIVFPFLVRRPPRPTGSHRVAGERRRGPERSADWKNYTRR